MYEVVVMFGRNGIEMNFSCDDGNVDVEFFECFWMYYVKVS